MSSATTCGNHSGPSRTPFQVRPKSVRLPPGILFAFILESCSESTRNAVRLHPGNPFALARNPHAQPRCPLKNESGRIKQQPVLVRECLARRETRLVNQNHYAPHTAAQ